MKGFLRGGGAAICVLFLLVLRAASGSGPAYWEVDATATETWVIDGDTFKAVPVGRVRLADINTPEAGQPGAREATAYLTLLVHRKLVYLDIDDVHGRDRYGRVVAVVYIRYNSSHLLNVNKALVDTGLATMWDFPNEFDPAAWSGFVYHPGEDAGTRDHWSSNRPFKVAILIGSSAAGFIVYPLLRRRNSL